MSARTKARKRALDVLYVADIRQISMTDALAAETARARQEPERNSSWGYARDLVQGVIDHQAEIDELKRKVAELEETADEVDEEMGEAEEARAEAEEAVTEATKARDAARKALDELA